MKFIKTCIIICMFICICTAYPSCIRANINWNFDIWNIYHIYIPYIYIYIWNFPSSDCRLFFSPLKKSGNCKHALTCQVDYNEVGCVVFEANKLKCPIITKGFQ